MTTVAEASESTDSEPAFRESANLCYGPEPPLRHLDVNPLRGLVCFGILVMHLYNGTVHANLERLFGEGVGFAISHLRLGYESFFVLAGFFLARTFQEAEGRRIASKKLLLRRSIRLLVPYWVALALVYLDRWLPNILLGRSNPLPSIAALAAQAACIQDLVGVPSISAVFWSMAVVIQAFFIWAVVFWVLRKVAYKFNFRDKEGWVDSCTMALMGVFWCTSLILAWVHLGAEWKLPETMKFISLGAACAWVADARLKQVWLIAAILVTLVLVPSLPLGQAARVVASLATAAALMVLASGYQLPKILPIRVLEWIGVRSYSLYLTHAMVGYRVLNLSNHIENSGPYLALELLALAIICAIAFGNLFYWLVEVPTLRLSRAVLYRF